MKVKELKSTWQTIENYGIHLDKLLQKEEYIVQRNIYVFWLKIIEEILDEENIVESRNFILFNRAFDQAILSSLDSQKEVKKNLQSIIKELKKIVDDNIFKEDSFRIIEKLCQQISNTLSENSADFSSKTRKQWDENEKEYKKTVNDTIEIRNFFKAHLDNALHQFLLHCEEKILTLQKQKLFAGLSSGEEKDLKKLQDIRHLCIGASQEWERVQVLQKFLSNQTSTSKMSHYVKAREELENTLASIQTKRTNIQPKEPIKVESVKENTYKPLLIIGKNDQNSVNEITKGIPEKEKPEFILVIEPGKGN